MSDAVFEKHFVSLVTRLASAEWFPPKVSSCALFADALKRSSATSRDKLLPLYVSLCKDETPMVRRAAASNLKVRAHFISSSHLSAHIPPPYP